MNKHQRATVQNIIYRLTELADGLAGEAYKPTFATAYGIMDSAHEDFEDMSNEEQDKYDNMPEALQDGEKGEALQSAAEALQSAADYLENLPEVEYQGWDEDCIHAIAAAVETAEQVL